MKYVDEFRDGGLAKAVLAEIRRTVTRPWTIMEVCGGQTHTIIKQGLDEMLPPDIELVHGPGCPVCVTPLELIDKAIAIASTPATILVSFGDMLRVPGSRMNLFAVRSEGGDVRVVYSPLDCLRIARENPDKKVVFFGVGFETTAPANAMAILRARELGLSNFYVLVSHVLVPPAIVTLLESEDNRVQAFLAPGHVCTVMGWTEYEPIAAHYRVPIIVTGFEPLDILQGLLMAVRQLEEGRAEVENQYVRSVTRWGNLAAQEAVLRVFEPCPRKWRGIGAIPASGYRLRDEFASYDAEGAFALGDLHVSESPLCISGLVLRGQRKPHQCPAFGSQCTPQHPLGAPMVSAEGACAAYYNYRRSAQTLEPQSMTLAQG